MTSYVVTGRHRTGTSMMMAALSQSIITTVTDANVEALIRSREVDPNYDPNPLGYFAAPNEIVPIDWPNALMKCPVYRWAYVDTASLMIVQMQRNETDRVTSYERSFGSDDAVSIGPYEAGESVLATTSNVTVVQFEDMLVDPVGQFQRLVDAGWPIDPVLCSSVVDPALWRNRG